MSRVRIGLVVGIGTLATLVVLWIVASRRSVTEEPSPLSRTAGPAAAATRDAALYVPIAPERAAPTEPAVERLDANEGSEPPVGDALVAALREAGAAYRAGELERLQAALESILADPDTIEQLLELWRKEALREDHDAALGALMALETALVYFGRHEDLDPLQARAFVRTILYALPEIPQPERGQAVERLVAAELAGRPILDARFLRDVLDLRLAWPELRAELALLLTNLGRGLEGDEGLEGFYAVLANEQDDPLAVTIALSALLETGSETFLSMAEQMFHESRDPELRAAVVRAVVTSLPVERAAEAFTDLAGPRSWADAWSLGAREGGAEALQLAYERELAAGGQDAQAREMLVVGMASASRESLMRITRSDPDVSVRAQAWLTLTANGEPDAGSMAALTAAVQLGSSGAGLTPGLAIGPAENALRIGTASARAAARELLLSIAADQGAESWERRNAARALETHAPGSLPLELHALLEED